MKEVIGDIYKELPMCKIYMGDIMEIVKILQKIPPQSIEITSDNLIYDDFFEFTATPPSIIKHFKIRTSNPNIIMELKPNRATIYSSSDNILSVKATVTDIVDFIYKKRRFFHHISPNPLYTPFFMMPVLFVFTYFFSIKLLNFYEYSVSCIFIGFITICLIINREINYTKIYPIDKASKPGFFTRNGDDLIKMTISATLGALLGNIDRIIKFFLK